jgi:hypothetical protein
VPTPDEKVGKYRTDAEVFENKQSDDLTAESERTDQPSLFQA